MTKSFGHLGIMLSEKLGAALRFLLPQSRATKPILDSRLKIPAGIAVVGQPHPHMRYTKDTVAVCIPKTSDPETHEWAVSSDLTVEIHGHCVAIYTHDMTKIAEAFVEAPVSVVLRAIDESASGVGSTAQGVGLSTIVPHGGLVLRIRHRNFQLENRGIASPSGSWQRWHQAERSLTYLLEAPRSVSGRSRLVVVFSAISKRYDFTYNYRAAISELDSYRLFVLDDFGARGSYYLSDHRDLSIYDSVQAFLKHIVRELKVDLKNITFAGSSKGGTAALIHGLPMGVGSIIVGAPQSKPGVYLISSDPEMLEFIAADSGPTGRDWLDDTVGGILSQEAPDTQVRVLVGDADHHLSAHVRPLEDKLEINGTGVQTLIVQGVNHQDIGRPFSTYLRQSLDMRNNQPADAVVPYELTWQTREDECALLKVWVPQGEVIAVRAYAGAVLLASHDYSNENTFTFTVPKGESLRIRIYRKCAGSRRRRGAFTTPWLRPPTE